MTSVQYLCKERECRQPCVFTSSQLTCMSCGLEQDVPVFEDEWNVFERTCFFDVSCESDKADLKLNDIFEKIQSDTKVSDDVIITAKKLLELFFQRTKKIIKGEQRRTEFCTSCVFFASRNMTRCAFVSQTYICQKVGVPSIQWACKELSDELINTEFRYLFITSSEQIFSKIIDTFPRLIRISYDFLRAKPKIDKNLISLSEKQFMGKCTKIVDILRDHAPDVLFLSQIEKLIASIIFVTFKILKIPFKLNDIAQLLNVSEPLVLKMEKIILNSIQVSKKRTQTQN